MNVLGWLRVDPSRPQVVYAGGYAGLAADPAFQGEPACGFRIGRSADAGSTWQHELGTTAFYPYVRFFTLNDPIIRASHNGCVPSDPLIVSPDGADLFSIGYTPYCDSVRGCGPYVSHSADRGAHWMDILFSNHLVSDYPVVNGFSISQADPKRSYVSFTDASGGQFVARSDDGGARWHSTTTVAGSAQLLDGSYLASHGLYGQVLADPSAPGTIYLGLGIPMPPRAVALARSDDGGKVGGCCACRSR